MLFTFFNISTKKGLFLQLLGPHCHVMSFVVSKPHVRRKSGTGISMQMAGIRLVSTDQSTLKLKLSHRVC